MNIMVRIGDLEVPDPPDDPDEYRVWLETELSPAGAALLEDERTHDMRFGGRPVTMMEMLAAAHAEASWIVAGRRWVEQFTRFLESKLNA